MKNLKYGDGPLFKIGDIVKVRAIFKMRSMADQMLISDYGRIFRITNMYMYHSVRPVYRGKQINNKIEMPAEHIIELFEEEIWEKLK